MSADCLNAGVKMVAVAHPQAEQLLSTVRAEATAALIVNLGAVRRNYRLLCELAPQSETSAVVKADAYGLGAARVARALMEDGCRTFFVATLKEAAALRPLSQE